MNKLSWILAVIFGLIIVVRCQTVIAAEDPLKEINASGFPLTTGFHWEYNYVSEDQDPNGKSLADPYGSQDGPKVKVNRVEQTMTMQVGEILIENGNIRADVTGNSLLIFANPESVRDYSWVYQPSTGGFWEGTTSLRNDFVDNRLGLTAGRPLLLLPPKIGRHWGEISEVKRNDTMYRWEVETKEVVKVPAGNFMCYRLAYRTNPDHQIIWFCPKVGIVKMQYVHHGTIMNTFIELTAYGQKK